MSETPKKLIQPPRSPPMDIPKKERSIFNAFSLDSMVFYKGANVIGFR